MAGSGTPLVGRKPELAAVERMLGGLLDRRARALEIAGEPGIGKTRLLSELCTVADDQGLLALEGRAAEFESDVPFGVFVAALDDYLGTVNPHVVFRGLEGEQAGHLAAIFPALHDLSGDREAALQDERYRSYRAIRILLEALASERPLVLALDDLHWADDASLELLSHLLRHRPRARVLLAFAHRPRQLAVGAPAAVVRSITGQADERLELAPLSPAEAEGLLGERVPAALRPDLYRESGGNPFYLGELARHSGSPLDASHTQAAPGDIPAAVSAALDAELAALSPRGTEVARAAAVAGEPFEPELVAAVAELAEAETLAAVDELVRLDLVRPALTPRRFAFRHPIVRRAVYEAAAPGWRIAAHARAAEALERAGASPLARARHVEYSASPGDEAAVEVLAAAGHAAAPRAPAVAAHWYEAALRLLPERGPEASRRLELLVPMASALGAAGRLEESRAALRQTAALLPPELAPLRGQAVAFIAMIEHLLGRHGEASALLRAALAELPDERSPEAVALKVELAMDSLYAPDYEGMLAWAREAHSSARGLGDRPRHAAAAGALALAEYNVGRIGAAESAHAEAAGLVDALSDEELAGLIDALLYLGWSCQSLEHLEDGVRYLERGLAVSRATGQGHLLVPMTIGIAICMTWRGRLAEAAELAEETIESARLALNPQSLAWSLTLRCWIATLAGDLTSARACGAEALEVSGGSVRDNYFSALSGCYVAETLLESGEPGPCRDELLNAARGAELPVIEPSYRAHFYEILTRAALALGDLDEAEEWVTRADDAVAGSTLGGRLAEARLARAAVRLARGDCAGATEDALEAASAAARPGDRILLGRARTLAGRSLAVAGEHASAARELEDALAELEACGARRFADEAASELRRLGRRVPRKGSPGTTSWAWERSADASWRSRSSWRRGRRTARSRGSST